MQRLPHWQSALSAYLRQVDRRPFAYGDLDCGLFCAGAVLAMTGTDPATELRGRYESRLAAFRAIKALCGDFTVEAIAVYMAAQVGAPEISLLHAQRGDPVLLGRGRRSSLGILAMHGTEILQAGPEGILRMPLNLATRAWHI